MEAVGMLETYCIVRFAVETCPINYGMRLLVTWPVTPLCHAIEIDDFVTEIRCLGVFLRLTSPIEFIRYPLLAFNMNYTVVDMRLTSE